MESKPSKKSKIIRGVIIAVLIITFLIVAFIIISISLAIKTEGFCNRCANKGIPHHKNSKYLEHRLWDHNGNLKSIKFPGFQNWPDEYNKIKDNGEVDLFSFKKIENPYSLPTAVSITAEEMSNIRPTAETLDEYNTIEGMNKLQSEYLGIDPYFKGPVNYSTPNMYIPVAKDGVFKSSVIIPDNLLNGNSIQYMDGYSPEAYRELYKEKHKQEYNQNQFEVDKINRGYNIDNFSTPNNKENMSIFYYDNPLLGGDYWRNNGPNLYTDGKNCALGCDLGDCERNDCFKNKKVRFNDKVEVKKIEGRKKKDKCSSKKCNKKKIITVHIKVHMDKTYTIH